jgi:oligopeptide/dipeptide ABC transporter ATP-binding protein
MPSTTLNRPETIEPAPEGGPAALLRIESLQVEFDTPRGRLRAVDGVDLTVAAGETLGVVGESGSGKSVTGLAAMRLLGRTTGRVMGGQILFRRRDGTIVDLATLPENAMQRIHGREIAMVFQDPLSSLDPVFTIGEQLIETICQHHRCGTSAARHRAAELLTQVGIAGAEARLASYPHQLSGGMRQRVVIAMALAGDPALLIADEPTTALDVTVQAQIVALLKGLQRERRMAMVFVTHDLNLVLEVADRVAVMYAGRVVEAGPTAAVLAKPLHPYTRALLRCNPHHLLVDASAGPLEPIPGTTADPLDPPPGCRFHPRCPYAIEACRRIDPPAEVPAPGRSTRCIRWAELA